MNIKEVIKENPEGFSINTNLMALETPKTGYMVSITNNKTTLESSEALFNRLLKVMNALSISKHDKFIGGWKEGKNYYLDGSIQVLTEIEAQYLGTLFNQKAYYDCKKQRSVEL